jgi:hypothetical protein
MVLARMFVVLAATVLLSRTLVSFVTVLMLMGFHVLTWDSMEVLSAVVLVAVLIRASVAALQVFVVMVLGMLVRIVTVLIWVVLLAVLIWVSLMVVC